MKSFLMLGQSNMAGRGDFGEVSEDFPHIEFGMRYLQTYIQAVEKQT